MGILHPSGGVARYRDGGFRYFPPSEGAPDSIIYRLYADERGRLWMSGNPGLVRVEGPTAETPRFERFFPELTALVIDITEDTKGHLYLATGRGIVRADPSSGTIKRFNESDGFPAMDTFAAFRDRHGALWFGMYSGVARFVAGADLPVEKPSIRIGGIRAAGVLHALSRLGGAHVGPIELGADGSHVQIEYFGLSRNAGETLRYQYASRARMRSAETDLRAVHYAGLAPGTYRFLVRAVNAEGVVSDPATADFTVIPPVWARWWVRLAVALGFVAMAGAAYRMRIRRLIEVERVRARIATDLHDDLGANLSQIAILSEVARRQLGRDGYGAGVPLARIGDLSRAFGRKCSRRRNWPTRCRGSHLRR